MQRDTASSQSPSAELGGLKILFLVTEDWYFCSHRLPIARAARDAGAEVVVATRVDRHADAIEREGFRLVALPWRRRSKNLLAELKALLHIIRMYRRERPDIVHHVAVKPAVFGGIAAAIGGRPAQVNAIAGFGYVSTSPQLLARLLRPAVRVVFRRVLNRPESFVIVQNPDDAAALTHGRLFDESRIRIIRGSGVDTERFRPAAGRAQGSGEEGDARMTAVLAARMLTSKGIRETAAAARALKARAGGVRVVLVGDPDPENPESIGADIIDRWVEEGIVEWRGHVEDMVGVWQSAQVGLLPSYREGLPMSLLEAASCGLPLVATDVPGCREIVRDGENGLLVPVRSIDPIAGALETLASDADLRNEMGRRSREMVEESFAERIVVRETLSLYASISGGRP
jgi:glycosyltransferase involved in cell wall biosynthesis